MIIAYVSLQLSQSSGGEAERDSNTAPSSERLRNFKFFLLLCVVCSDRMLPDARLL
jgi:hypothetical protein